MRALGEAVTELAVHERGRIGPHAVVLDQRAWAKVPESYAAEYLPLRLDAHATRDDSIHRAWNMVASRIIVCETRSRERDIGIQPQPWRHLDQVRPFHAQTPGWSTCYGCTDIPKIGRAHV